MTMFNLEFKTMVEENALPFIIHRKAGASNQYYKGDLVKPGTVPIEAAGILIPFTDDDLRYSEGGTYSVKDKKLYVLEEIPFGTEIEYKGIKYTVQQFRDYRDYSDVFIYVARYAGSGAET